MGHCDVIYCNMSSSAARRWTKEQRLILEMFAGRHLCTGATDLESVASAIS